MNVQLDMLIEPGHPQQSELIEATVQMGSVPTVRPNSDWLDDSVEGHATHIVCIPQQSSWTVEDLRELRLSEDSHTAAIQLIPGRAARLKLNAQIWGHCPQTISMCWNNPAEDFAIVIARAAWNTLAASRDNDRTLDWQWLLQCQFERNHVVLDTNTFRAPQAPSQCTDSRWGTSSRLPQLVPSDQSAGPDRVIRFIHQLRPSQLIPFKVSEADAVACKAGLLQWHDALDLSHQLAQSVEGLGRQQAGDYWHAIMHRREPDYSNARYWFRQFRYPAITDQLAPFAEAVLNGIPEGPRWQARLTSAGQWDPLAFVNLCEECHSAEDSPLGLAARQIQAQEMRLLMIASCENAFGRAR